MQQIKFRAWDSESENMIETFDANYKILINEETGSVFCGGFMSNGDWNEPVLMLFTGLLDKNRNEIFEGDIVQHDYWDYPFQVIFDQEKARFVCKMKTGLTQSINNHSLKVIGNVYQNYNLLESLNK
jgi:uncharacterized phage protein (TIGR01671 family)